MKSLWPKREQWARWSLPSKLTALGALVGVVALLLFLLDFGFRLVDSKASQEQPVDVDAIVETLTRQLGYAEEREQGYRDQIKALTKAVESLAAQRGTPKAPERLDDALRELAQGRAELARDLLRGVAAEREAHGDLQGAAEALRHLGALAFLDDTTAALAAYRRATELDPENPNGWNQLGHLLHRTGDLPEAESAYQRVLAFGESMSDPVWEATGLGSLGIVYEIRGELDQAVEMYEKALALNQELGSKEGMATNYGNRGNVHLTRGELDQAVEMYEKSLALYQELGSKEGMAANYGNLGTVYYTRGELDQAVEMYEKSLALNQELGRKEGMALAYGNLGNVHLTRGELDQAVEMYEKSLALNQELGSKEWMAANYGNLGRVYKTRGEPDQAVEMYEKSLAIETELGRKEGMAIAYSHLGIVYKARGDLDQAREAWAKARDLFEKVGIPGKVTLVEQWLSELEG